MDMNERNLEAAERNVALEADTKVAGIRASLCLRGDEFCVDCTEQIEPARRAAMPSAMRCIECQRKHERGRE